MATKLGAGTYGEVFQVYGIRDCIKYAMKYIKKES